MKNKIKQAEKQLEIERNKINGIDLEITKLLDKRVSVVSKIQKVKSELGLPIFQPGREQVILERVKAKSKNPEFAENTFRAMLEQSRKLQEVER
jgi:monofunctional chorismate mutase